MEDQLATGLWWVAVAVAVVVTVVVAGLLALIVRTAEDIEAAVSEIWTRGQLAANNTIHIFNLYKTDELVGRLLGRIRRIVFNAEALARHARSCPGCPACLRAGR